MPFEYYDWAPLRRNLSPNGPLPDSAACAIIDLMDMVLYPLAVLVGTLLVIVLVDWGAPNTLEAVAFSIERHANWTVAALRSTAAKLRRRQRAIELENQARLGQAAAYHQAAAETIRQGCAETLAN